MVPFLLGESLEFCLEVKDFLAKWLVLDLLSINYNAYLSAKRFSFFSFDWVLENLKLPKGIYRVEISLPFETSMSAPSLAVLILLWKRLLIKILPLVSYLRMFWMFFGS